MMRNRIQGWTPVVILFLAVQLLTSCNAAKQSRSRQTQVSALEEKKTDSAAVLTDRSEMTAQKIQDYQTDRRSMGVTQETVPEQEANLTIPLQNLLNLPDGAGYTKKDGRASVDLRRSGDHLVATGHCDSLARLCLFYEEEVFRKQTREDSLEHKISSMEAERRQSEMTAKMENLQSQTIKKKPPAVWYLWLLTGMAAGVLISSPLKRVVNKVFTFIKRLYE